MGKWFINKNPESLNYGRHYCSNCGSYPISYPTSKNDVTNSSSTLINIYYAFCPFCGTRNTVKEKLNGTFEDVHVIV